ncbi:MAG: cation:proton antiporter [Phycisphaerae bacterium]|nr:cation:proton antiporter [Phycisphaerae bacterium]
MESTAGLPLVALALFLLAGYVAHVTGPRMHVPSVTLLLVAGAVCGPAVLDIVPESVSSWFPMVAHMALAMVGFLLGERLVGRGLRKHGRTVFAVMGGKVSLVCAFVFVAALLAGAPLPLALLLAGIAPASAPAAIYETVREERAAGPLTDTVLGVVAIDDAVGVILFSVLFVAAQATAQAQTDAMQIARGLWEVGGAVALGAAVGVPMAWITRRIRRGEPTLVEAAGFVFLVAGAASMLHVSYLLAAMTLGAVLAWRVGDNARPFHAIEGVSEPFLAVFFILAGFRFRLDALGQVGWIAAAYVAARTAGLVIGGYAGGRLRRAPRVVRSHVGWCTLPQAGVALGFALLAREQMPEYGQAVLPLVIATTVLFEIVGPVIARWHLRGAGELGRNETPHSGNAG